MRKRKHAAAAAAEKDDEILVMRRNPFVAVIAIPVAAGLVALALHRYEAALGSERENLLIASVAAVLCAVYSVTNTIFNKIECTPAILSYRSLPGGWSLPLASIELAALETLKSAKNNKAVSHLPQLQDIASGIKYSRRIGSDPRLLILMARGISPAVRILDLDSFDARDCTLLVAKLAVHGVKAFGYGEPL